MTFPVWLSIGPWRAHPHFVFEMLAYIAGFWLYMARRRVLGDHLPNHVRWSLVAAAAVGAAIGSRVLSWLEDPSAMLQIERVRVVVAGKTAVGGLLGGWLAVELQKRRLRVQEATGHLFAVPLAVGLAIGRMGCFLSGLPDGTYGVETSLPWGIDLGDGVTRHPTALYESVFMLILAAALVRAERTASRGRVFTVFMIAYLMFRLAADAIKPGVALALGLTAIQWACVAGLVCYGRRFIAARCRRDEGVPFEQVRSAEGRTR